MLSLTELILSSVVLAIRTTIVFFVMFLIGKLVQIRRKIDASYLIKITLWAFIVILSNLGVIAILSNKLLFISLSDTLIICFHRISFISAIATALIFLFFLGHLLGDGYVSHSYKKFLGLIGFLLSAAALAVIVSGFCTPDIGRTFFERILYASIVGYCLVIFISCIYATFIAVRSRRLPKILVEQVTIFTKYLVIPNVVFNLCIFVNVIFCLLKYGMIYDLSYFWQVLMSASFLCGLFQCVRNLPGIRILNVSDQVIARIRCSSMIFGQFSIVFFRKN
jgi:hypothetical protein